MKRPKGNNKSQYWRTHWERRIRIEDSRPVNQVLTTAGDAPMTQGQPLLAKSRGTSRTGWSISLALEGKCNREREVDEDANEDADLSSLSRKFFATQWRTFWINLGNNCWKNSFLYLISLLYHYRIELSVLNQADRKWHLKFKIRWDGIALLHILILWRWKILIFFNHTKRSDFN